MSKSKPMNGPASQMTRENWGSTYSESPSPGGAMVLPVAIPCSNCSKSIPPRHPCITELPTRGISKSKIGNLELNEPLMDPVFKIILKVFNPMSDVVTDAQPPKFFLCTKCGHRLGEMYKFYQMFLDLTVMDSEVSKILRKPKKLECYSNGNIQYDLDMDSQPHGENESIEAVDWNPLDLLEVKLDTDAQSDESIVELEENESETQECITVPDTDREVSLSFLLESHADAQSGGGKRKSGILSRKSPAELTNPVPKVKPTALTASSLVKRRKIDHSPPLTPEVSSNLATAAAKAQAEATVEPPGIITLDSSSESDSESESLVLQLDDFELVNVKTDPDILYLKDSEVEEVVTTPVSTVHQSKRKSKLGTRPPFSFATPTAIGNNEIQKPGMTKTLTNTPTVTVTQQPVNLVFNYPYDLIAVLDPQEPSTTNELSEGENQKGKLVSDTRATAAAAKTKKLRQFKCPDPECTIAFPTKPGLQNHLMSATHNMSREEAKAEVDDLNFDPDSDSD